MLTTLAISGYRSLRNLVAPLKGLNLITGENGSGKSNILAAIQALFRLVEVIAQGGADLLRPSARPASDSAALRVARAAILQGLIQRRDVDPFDRSVDLRVMRLRKKIEPDPEHPQFIRTVRNEGYVFVPAGGDQP